MILKNGDAKFKEKLTRGFKNDIALRDIIWSENFLFYYKSCFPRKTWVLFVLL